jgi:hypothetical protein
MTENTLPAQKSGVTNRFSRFQTFNINRITAFYRNTDVWKGMALFTFFALGLGLIQFATPNLVGNDGYYHIKMAYLLRTEGLKPAFDWLPLTVLNAQEYYDHHYLYHVLMIPLTFGDLRLGAKLASIIFPALAFISIWWLLKGQNVPFASLWSLGLLVVSEAFLYRMNMPRAQSLSLLLLVWALHWLLKGRYRWLLPLGFIYVWSYNAFPLLIMVVGAYVAAHWLIKRELRWQPLAYAAAGVALGLFVNPYFPENLAFIYRHLAPKLADATSVSVGNEWFPYRTATLIENSGLALLAFLGGILALGMNDRRMNVATATSLLLVMLFGFMLFQSRRFVEYAPPFALIFAAMAWSPLIQGWRDKAQNFSVAADPKKRTSLRISSWFLPGLAIVILVPLLWLNITTSRKELQENAKPFQRFEGASAWLVENTPVGSRVFQTDWDDFPRLFFYNHHNTYTIGLDPAYMQLYDADLYDRWVAITQGEVDHPSQAIKDQFGGQYIISDLKHKGFLRVAEADEQIIRVYEDEYAIVFQVLPKNFGSRFIASPPTLQSSAHHLHSGNPAQYFSENPYWK